MPAQAVWKRVLIGLATLVMVIGLGIFPGAIKADSAKVALPNESLLTDPVFARPGYAGVAQAFLRRSRYLLALDVDPTRGRITGQARILFVNNTGVALNSIVLRLYQNHPTHKGRRMTVQSVSVNGSATTGTLKDQYGTVYEVPLASPLQPGGALTLDLGYQITVPTSSFFYVSEPFPMLAVHDSSGWREEVATKGLDYNYSESALYAVNLRAPTDVGTWFTGAIKTAEQAQDGTTTYTIVTGPMRNFVLLQARGWGTLDMPGGPVPIKVLYSGSQAAAQEMANITVAAMNFFDVNFGPYPYAEFDIISMVFATGGEEYPSLIFVNNQQDSDYRRFITAHEVAHQWFYGLAGDDVLRNAWLDESVVQIAGYLFYERTHYGSPNSAEEFWAHILTWYNRIQGTPKVINTPLENFRDFNDYMSTTYGGGAVFLRELAGKIGENALIAGLRSYVQNVYLGVGTPRQFFDSIQAQTSVSLAPLFCQRVGIVC